MLPLPRNRGRGVDAEEFEVFSVQFSVTEN